MSVYHFWTFNSCKKQSREESISCFWALRSFTHMRSSLSLSSRVTIVNTLGLYPSWPLLICICCLRYWSFSLCLGLSKRLHRLYYQCADFHMSLLPSIDWDCCLPKDKNFTSPLWCDKRWWRWTDFHCLSQLWFWTWKDGGGQQALEGLFFFFVIIIFIYDLPPRPEWRKGVMNTW